MRVGGGGTNGTLTWLMADVQNSAQISINASTGVSAEQLYSPFGAQRGAQGPPSGSQRGFLNNPYDPSTGLIQDGARLYDPALARFLSPDSITTPHDPQNLNVYSYASNRPTTASDASGLMRVDDQTSSSPCNDACQRSVDAFIEDQAIAKAKAAAEARREGIGRFENNDANAIGVQALPLNAPGHALKGVKDIQKGAMSKESGILRREGTPFLADLGEELRWIPVLGYVADVAGGVLTYQSYVDEGISKPKAATMATGSTLAGIGLVAGGAELGMVVGSVVPGIGTVVGCSGRRSDRRRHRSTFVQYRGRLGRRRVRLCDKLVLMTPYLILPFVWIIAVFSVGKAVFLWRGSTANRDIESYSAIAIPFGPGIRRGAARAFVPMAFVTVGIAIIFTSGPFVNKRMAPGAPAVVLLDIGFALLFVGFLFIASIAVINRPKFLLPRYLRTEVGALGAWIIRMGDRREMRKENLKSEVV